MYFQRNNVHHKDAIYFQRKKLYNRDAIYFLTNMFITEIHRISKEQGYNRYFQGTIFITEIHIPYVFKGTSFIRRYHIFSRNKIYNRDDISVK